MPQGVIKGDHLLMMGTGRGEGAYVVRDDPQRVMRLQEQGEGVLALSEVEELLCDCMRCLELRPCIMERLQRTEHRGMLRGLSHPLRQRSRPRAAHQPAARPVTPATLPTLNRSSAHFPRPGCAPAALG
jgi:hypothetical protein